MEDIFSCKSLNLNDLFFCFLGQCLQHTGENWRATAFRSWWWLPKQPERRASLTSTKRLCWPRAMMKAVRTVAPAWAFRTRFRRAAFGWKGTQLALGRIHEALAEIRAVARHDPATAGEGAMLFLEKLSPALCQIDSSSGSLGNSPFAAVQELPPLVSNALVSAAVRKKWLDHLFEAIQEDDPPYMESLGDVRHAGARLDMGRPVAAHAAQSAA